VSDADEAPAERVGAGVAVLASTGVLVADVPTRVVAFVAVVGFAAGVSVGPTVGMLAAMIVAFASRAASIVACVTGAEAGIGVALPPQADSSTASIIINAMRALIPSPLP